MKHVLFLSILMAANMASTAQTAQFSYFSYGGDDTRFDKEIDRSRQYFNPILAGFYPDPSICRKGTPIIWSTLLSRFSPACPSSRARTS